MDKIINLNQLFNSSSLIARQAARELFDIISRSSESSIILDFSNIEFASRSFFDELNSKRSNIKLLGKQVSLINLRTDLRMLLELVENSAKEKSSTTYSSIANAKSMTI